MAEVFLSADFDNIRRYKEFEISPQGEFVGGQQARSYDGAIEQRSTLEDADFHLFADTEVRDKATASRILRQGEEEYERKAEAALRISVHHYTLKALDLANIN